MINLSKKQLITYSKLWAKKFQAKHKLESKKTFRNWTER